MIAATAKTVDEAVTKTLIEPGTTSDKLGYEVIDKRSIGFLGIGAKPVITHAKKKESIEDRTMNFLSQILGTTNMQVNIITAYNQGEQGLSLNLEDKNMGILIGERGQTLGFLQYLVSLIVNKGTEGYLGVKLDTENYRERRKETLKTLAKNIAYKVKRTGRPVLLEPMNPYERGIIHAALRNDKYITTRNEGGEPFCCAVIALKREVASSDRKGCYDRSKKRRFKRFGRSDGYRNNHRTNGSSASQTGPDASAETAAGEEE